MSHDGMQIVLLAAAALVLLEKFLRDCKVRNPFKGCFTSDNHFPKKERVTPDKEE